MCIRQPCMHRCQTDLRAVADEQETECHLGQRRIQSSAISGQILRVKRLRTAKCQNLRIVEQDSPEQSQTNADCTDHDIFPGRLERSLGELERHQQRGYQRRSLNSHPHQTQIIHQNDQHHGPDKKMRQRIKPAFQPAEPPQITISDIRVAIQIGLARPGKRQIKHRDNQQHPKAQRIQIEIAKRRRLCRVK